MVAVAVVLLAASATLLYYVHRIGARDAEKESE